MTIQYSIPVNNARLDSIETSIGSSAVLAIRTGAVPASCVTANSGTVLATVALPADWMNAASGGSKTKSGTWQDASADGTGTAGHFRVYDGAGVCHIQGSLGLAGSGMDMILDSVQFTAGQTFSVNTFTVTAANI